MRARLPTVELGILMGTLAAVTVMLLRFRKHVDDDLWLHLRLGDEIRAGERFGGTDPLTALADRPYVPTQWLAEVIASVTYELSGLYGIHLIRLLAVVAVAALTYASIRTITDPPRAAAITLPTLFATSAAWAERPQLIGLAMHALVVLLWMRAWRSGRTPWLVVPTTWLWACLHGTWALGIVTGTVFAIGLALDSADRRSWRRDLAVLSLSIAAVGATPLGPVLLIQPLTVSEAARASVSEWQTPSFDNPTFVAVLIMAAWAAIAPARRRVPSWLAIGLVGLGAALAIYSVRTVAFGAILAGVGIAMSALKGRQAFVMRRRAEVSVWLTACLVVVVGGSLWAMPTPELADQGLRGHLQSIPRGSNIAVQPEASGWVLFHEPALRPLRDLRAEAYSPTANHTFEHIWEARPGWESALESLDVHAVLVRSGEALAGALPSTSWSLVAAGNDYQLWTSTMDSGTETT